MIAHEEVVHLQFPNLHGAAGNRPHDRGDAQQLGLTPPREGKVAAVVADGDLGDEGGSGGGGGGRPAAGRRTLGPRSRAPVLGVEPFADRMAEVLRPLLRDLGEILHALAAALGTAVAQLVRARKAAWRGHPHLKAIVEALQPRRQRLLRGLVMPRPGFISVGIAKGICLFPVVRPDPLVLDGPSGQQPTASQGSRLARELPPLRKVLRGDNAPELSSGDAAILHDTRLQPLEVGLRHDGLAFAHQPRSEFLGEAEVGHRREQPAGGP